MCRSWQRRTRRRWGRSWCNSAPPYSPATGWPFVWPLVSVNDWWCDDTGKRVLKRGMIWYFFSGKTVQAQAARASWSCLSVWSCCLSTPTASWRATPSPVAGDRPISNLNSFLKLNLRLCSDLGCDDRAFHMSTVSSMDVASSLVYFYPRLIPLHTVNPEETGVPEQIRWIFEEYYYSIELILFFCRCTMEKVRDEGVYLLENGIHVLLFVGLAVDPQWIQVWNKFTPRAA